MSAFNENGLTETARTWSSGLRGLTGEQIANGLRKCVACGESWPPTLPQFVSMCKGKQTNGFGLNSIPEFYREPPRESLIESDEIKEKRKIAAKKGMSNINEILKR